MTRHKDEITGTTTAHALRLMTSLEAQGYTHASWKCTGCGDPRAITSQYLKAVEVATIGDGIELISLQNGHPLRKATADELATCRPAPLEIRHQLSWALTVGIDSGK